MTSSNAVTTSDGTDLGGPPPRTIPTLDISEFRRGGPDADAFLAGLREAAHGPGFFYLVGHGVPGELTERVLSLSRRFFHQPEADRLAIENVNSPHFRGYTRPGHEITGGRRDLREQIDIGDERPARTLGPDDPVYLRLDGPNQWPPAVPELRGAVGAYMTALGALAQVLVRAFAASLGLAADHLDPTFAEEPRSHLKVIRYLAPPPDEYGPGYDQGVGDHADGGFVTFVLQDETGGLEVADGAGGWSAAPPVPGTFVVNIGEMFELATHRYYRATRHRVVSPPAGRERVSVAFFFGPRLSATLAPLPLPDDLLRQVPPGGSPDPDNPIFANQGVNTLKSWLRSHPEVARRHYADVAAPAAGSAGPAY